MSYATLDGIDFDHFDRLAAREGIDRADLGGDFNDTWPHPGPLRETADDILAAWESDDQSALVLPVVFGPRLRIPGRFSLRFSARRPDLVRLAEDLHRGRYAQGDGSGPLHVDHERLVLWALPQDGRGTRTGADKACVALRDALRAAAYIAEGYSTLYVPALDDVAYALPHWQACRPALDGSVDDRYVFSRIR